MEMCEQELSVNKHCAIGLVGYCRDAGRRDDYKAVPQKSKMRMKMFY